MHGTALPRDYRRCHWRPSTRTSKAEPDLAVELDRDGQVVAQQYLALRHRAPDTNVSPANEDEFTDLSDEAPLPVPLDVSQARPAKACECPDAIGHDGACVLCGHALPEADRYPKRPRAALA